MTLNDNQIKFNSMKIVYLLIKNMDELKKGTHFLLKAMISGSFLIILIFNSLIMSTNSEDVTLGKLSAFAQTSSEWQSLDITCFDSHGNPTGKHRTNCYQGGVLASCSAHDCE